MWFKEVDEEKKMIMRWFIVSIGSIAFLILAAILIVTAIYAFVIIPQREKNKSLTQQDSMKFNNLSQDELPTHEDYMNIKALHLNEDFYDGFAGLSFDFETNKLRYVASNSFGILEGHFTEDEKVELILLLEEYKYFEWLDGRYYWDLLWNPQNCDVTSYALNPDANNTKRTEFYSLNKAKYYMGLGKDEFWYRTETYMGELTHDNYESGQSPLLKYETTGVPDGYSELLDELWDFALSKVQAVDWRIIIDRGSKAGMLKKFPYMGKETAGIPDSSKMWYFSINEFFGGKEHGPGASMRCSRIDNYQPNPAESIWYNTWYDTDLNLVDTAGNIQTYREADEWFENKWTETEHIMPSYSADLNEEGKRKLAGILDKYQITAWQEPQYYQNQLEPCHIEEGDFFNLIPNKQYEGISEQEIEIRSTFETFIYLYDTDGKRLRLHYDNTGLPENYNEFREELWNFVMEYRMEQSDYYTMEEPYKSDRKNKLDWRNQLDQWGRDHLEIMEKKGEEEKGTD